MQIQSTPSLCLNVPSKHNSCIPLTREKSNEVNQLKPLNPAIRSIKLEGLDSNLVLTIDQFLADIAKALA